MEFNKSNADHIYESVKQFTRDSLSGSPFTMSRCTGKWDSLGMTITIKLAATGSNGATQATRDYKLYAPRHCQDWLGEAIIAPSGKYFEVTGWNKSAKKNKVLLRNLDTDEKRICSVEFLHRCEWVS